MNQPETNTGRFTVLGSVSMIGPSGQERAFVGRLQRLLGALLINVNRVVSIDLLTSLLWEGEHPDAPRAQVHATVHALRAEIRKLGIAATIETRAPGYVLRANEAQVDSEFFRRGAEEARQAAAAGNRQGAVSLYRESLNVWRGKPFDGVSGPLRDQADGLEAVRLEVLQECLELELELLGERKTIGELRAEVGRNPLHEGLRGLLMRALSRMGRQSEALEVYTAGRTLLLRELGVEPGAQLKELHMAVLTGKLATTAVKAPECQAVLRVRPRQLPSALGELAGRDAVIAELVAAVRSAEPVLNITGMPGVGKSSVGVAVAHRCAEAFPDGQLFVDFGVEHGVTLTAGQALVAFLRALGVGGTAVPVSQRDRVELYRELLAERRVLVVLDGATRADQVESLLPRAPGCAVIIMSRSRLSLSVPCRAVRLDELDPHAGLTMLTGLIGADRVRAELSSAADLVAAVGGLPLALRVVGAKLASRPHLSLSAMAGQLADQAIMLDRLTHGAMVVRKSLEVAYEDLDSGAATLMEKLAMVDARSLPAWVAHAALDLDESGMTDEVENLITARLIDSCGDTSRFQFHTLVRLFAQQRGLAADPAAEVQVVSRVVGGWIHLTEDAHRALHGGDFIVLRGNPGRWRPPPRFAVEASHAPLTWLENERPQLLAAVEQAARLGLSGLCWELAVALVTLFEARGHFDDWYRTHDLALRTALVAGDERGVAAVKCSLSSLLLTQSRSVQAMALLAPSLEWFENAGDVTGTALARRNLGLLDRQRGDLVSARENGERALACFKSVDDPVGQAVVLNQLAQLELDTANVLEARELLTAALDLCGTVSNARILAQTKYKLGKALVAEGDHRAAADTMDEVLALVRSSGDEAGERYTLHALGSIHLKCERWDDAAAALKQAAELCERSFDHVGAARIWLDLAALEEREGRTESARGFSVRAEEVFLRYDMPTWVERAARMVEPAGTSPVRGES